MPESLPHDPFDAALDQASSFFRKETRKSALLELLAFLGIGATLGLTYFVITVLGQSLAIGFVAAFRSNWQLFAKAVMIGMLLSMLPIITPLLLNVPVFLITLVLRIFLDPRAARIWARVVLVGLMLLGGMIALTKGAFDEARKAQPILASEESKNIETLAKLTEGHRQELEIVSQRGGRLFSELAKTESDLRDARDSLAKTLAALNEQSDAAEQAAHNLENLKARKEQVDQRLNELERILEGQKPITQQDFDRANKYNLVLGLIIGFFGSLAASYAFRFLSGRRRKSEQSELGKNTE